MKCETKLDNAQSRALRAAWLAEVIKKNLFRGRNYEKKLLLLRARFIERRCSCNSIGGG